MNSNVGISRTSVTQPKIFGTEANVVLRCKRQKLWVDAPSFRESFSGIVLKSSWKDTLRLFLAMRPTISCWNGGHISVTTD